MLRGPDLTGLPVVPTTPAPTRSVADAPTVERAPATDDFRGTPEVIVVRPGDTLGSIAARHHVSLAELKELNPALFTEGRDARNRKRAANGHWIYPGDQVRLRPTTGQAGTESSTETLAAQVRAARLAASQPEATPEAAPASEPTFTATPQATAPSDPQEASPATPQETTQETTQQPTATSTEAATPTVEPVAETSAAPAPSPAPAADATPTPPEPAAVTPPPAKPVEVAAPQPAPPEPVKQEKAPEPPAKSANVYAIERYTPRPRPTSPPPMPTTMAAGQTLNKKEQLIIGGLLAGLSLIKLPNSIENSIGNSAVDEVLSKTPLYTRNPEIVRYVASVGAKLVNQSQRTDLDWRFYVVDSPQMNAFALPGGHVFITTAALRNLKSETELAGVLGHEIAHVEQRHSVKQLQKTLLAQGVAIAALGRESAGIQVAGQLAIGIAMNGYSRSQEDESDERGSELAYKAGYDPKGLLGFFETLQHAHPDSPEWMAWASDHPRTGDRIKNVQEHLAKKGLTDPRPAGPDPYRQVMSRM